MSVLYWVGVILKAVERLKLFLQKASLLSVLIQTYLRYSKTPAIVSQLYRFCISQNSVLLRQMPVLQSCEPVRTDTAQAGRRVILHCINTNCLLWVVIMDAVSKRNALLYIEWLSQIASV